MVPVMAHGPELMGVELVNDGPLGLSDLNALLDAADGKDAVVFGPGIDRGEETGKLIASLLEALSQTRPAHFVFISDYGAQHPQETGIPAIFHRFEQQLIGLGLPCTILRSAEHMQNWLRLGPVNFYPPETTARPFVSAFDVGEVAAQLLLDAPPAAPRILHLEGPRRYQLSEVGEALGQPLQAVPPDFRLAALLRAGLPPALAELLNATYAAHGQGLIEPEPGSQVLFGSTALGDALDKQSDGPDP